VDSQGTQKDSRSCMILWRIVPGRQAPHAFAIETGVPTIVFNFHDLGELKKKKIYAFLMKFSDIPEHVSEMFALPWLGWILYIELHGNAFLLKFVHLPKLVQPNQRPPLF
jgi:hypothetical protein